MRKTTLLALLSLAALVASPSVLAEDGRWRGPDGGLLPFTTDDEILEFLRDAEVVKRERLKRGINKHLKVRLAKDGVEAHAVFRVTNVKKPRHATGGQVYLDFHDSYIYECAAYELSRLLGLDSVPPCVLRKVKKRQGTMQLWIEGTMTEDERRRTSEDVPSALQWVRQTQTRWLFDALIYNFDRNQGNFVTDEDWKVWLIDHGRSFHKSEQIENLERIKWCRSDVWEKLRALDRETLDEHLGEWIEDERIAFVLRRRDVLVRHLEERIAETSEDAVLWSAPPF